MEWMERRKTANEYIRWRYSGGEDKESLVKVSMVLTEEEERLQREPFEVIWFSEEDQKVPQKAMKVVIELTGARRENKQKEYEYEVIGSSVCAFHI